MLSRIMKNVPKSRVGKCVFKLGIMICNQCICVLLITCTCEYKIYSIKINRNAVKVIEM